MEEERSSAEVESRHDDGGDSYVENLELEGAERQADENDSDDIGGGLRGTEDEKAKKEKKLQQKKLQEVFEVGLPDVDRGGEAHPRDGGSKLQRP